VPEGGIDLMNRGEMGSGHGWTMGWASSGTAQLPASLSRTRRERPTGPSEVLARS
jgi:hypothetical protein